MFLLLSLFYFFYFSIIGIYIIFMPKVLDTLGYTATEIGVIFASAPLVRFLLPFLFAKILKLDTKNFKIALVIMVFSAFSFYFNIYNFYKMLFSTIGFGIGLSVILPYIELISLEYVGKHRYGKVRLFGSIGFILVSLILVKFLSSQVIALNFLSFFTVLTAVIAFIIINKTPKLKQTQEKITNDINLLSDWKLWISLSLVQVSFGAFYNFFTIYETDYGVTLDTTVYLWSFGVVVEIFMLFFQGRLLGKNLLSILKFTIFAGAIRWFLIFLFPQNLPILFFAQSIHALSFALFHSASISYLFHLYKHKSLAQQFFSGIVYGLGGFVGALIAGVVYEHFPRYLFLSATFIILFAYLFIYLWEKQVGKAQEF